MIWFVDALLFVIAAVLALIAATRGRVVLRDSAREGVLDFFKLMPRIMLGVIDAGYIAALLPQEVVGRWLGADSGVTGIAIAMLGGFLTPGGPVIGFSIGTAALKGGAGASHCLHHRLGLVRDPAPVHLGARRHASQAGLAADCRLLAAADPGRAWRDAAGAAVNG